MGGDGRMQMCNDPALSALVLGTGAGLLFGGLRLDNTLAGVVIGYLFNEASAVTSYFYGEAHKSGQ